MVADPQIYLASQSPRRRLLLEQLGVGHVVLPVAVAEQVRTGEPAESYVRRVALDKARAGWRHERRLLDLPVLGADTEVVVDRQVQGKPRDRTHGLELLGRLSGRSHEVISAVALVHGQREQVMMNRSQVWFRELSPADRAAYWDTGEPADKAGAYAIQGRGAVFVERLDGSYSAVMGLPLFETAQLLLRFGIDVMAGK